MADTNAPSDEGTCTKIDARFWGIMNEVYVAAHVLKTKHNEVHQQGHRIKKTGTADERAEYQVVQATGGDPWFGLCRALAAVTHTKTGERDGKVMVRYEDLKSRGDVKAALRVLVDRMSGAGKAHGLMNDGSDRKKPVGYTGALLRPSMGSAFQALLEWDNYIAETQVSRMMNKLCQPGYVPPASQNQLALPAPGVASHRTPKRGLE